MVLTYHLPLHLLLLLQELQGGGGCGQDAAAAVLDLSRLRAALGAGLPPVVHSAASWAQAPEMPADACSVAYLSLEPEGEASSRESPGGGSWLRCGSRVGLPASGAGGGPLGYLLVGRQGGEVLALPVGTAFEPGSTPAAAAAAAATAAGGPPLPVVVCVGGSSLAVLPLPPEAAPAPGPTRRLRLHAASGRLELAEDDASGTVVIAPGTAPATPGGDGCSSRAEQGQPGLLAAVVAFSGPVGSACASGAGCRRGRRIVTIPRLTPRDNSR